MLVVGDSLTDDLQSWAEILRHVLHEIRPADDIEVVNAGLSAHSSAMVLRRWPSMLHPAPDWIICGLGGNDITRVAGGKPMIGLSESVANLHEMHRIAAERTSARWLWLTPAPLIEQRIAGYPPFRFGSATWRNEDCVRLADAIAGFGDPVVDLVRLFGVPAHPDLQGPDGVHPTLAGQRTITRAVVETLARLSG
ncbi:SGNH/GDSL hydrolase family protein [Gordonia sp. ABSL1-1]|uniref:SGNH/GDSL hydrolase family protein n=1 Tax=Gordonia sp. ABSL1-1 TaxID=3053923 RepID=UPI0025742511|nr:SGNH/GDSL hydrolase family protein [Gordonia sp. ABSL1-1]MDL9938623.1 SGNH/GDSL hydrolase family protein [Gordonia sp. ABSL1-1]